MPLAAEYPLLEILWTICIIALWVMWIWVVVWTLMDNFRRDDHGGWAKAAWTIFIIFLPLLGVLIYLIARPGDATWTGAGSAYTGYGGDPVDHLERLAALRDKGALTEEEFQAEKARIM